ncbi:hypothetical protein [uncultured Aquimarina sp.]|uniref:hypothetical protein n=1 Tax=uncultured Aquimarina sp. TaxID=575652 RepID=UPI002603B11D|nr:hypothetical protein [uncultured Aquimarina sp.]
MFDSIFDFVPYFIGFVVISLILSLRKKIKQFTVTKDFELSNIKDITNGLVKVEGTISSLENLISPLTETKCIGYVYKKEEHKYIRGKNEPSGIQGALPNGYTKWVTTESLEKCSDFYIEDDTGKIKVISKGIVMGIKSHETKFTESRKILHEEYLILPDDHVYTIVGTVSKDKKGTLIIKKDKGDQKLSILDVEYDELVNDILIPNLKQFGFTLLILVLFGFLMYYFRNS